jgi:hypothetical protein
MSIAVFLSIAAIGVQPVIAAPGVPPVTIGNPDAHARLAVQFLSTWDKGALGHGQFIPEDWPYIWFFSYYHVSDEKELLAHKRDLTYLINATSFNARQRLNEVPGSFGRLFWIDYRLLGWNPVGLRAVAERCPFFVDDAINHEHFAFLNAVFGLKSSGKKLLNIVRGDWLEREIVETERSPTYYDLLFGRQRYGDVCYDGVPRKGGSWQWVENKRGFVAPNFPRNLTDWDQAFGVDQVQKFARDQRIDVDFGAIIEGNTDNPKTGSIVALNNRLVANLTDGIGLSMKTFDTKKTAGLKDYSETLIYRNQKFYKGNGAQADFDAHELIHYLPNGLIAGLLTGGDENRVEVADPRVAQHTQNKRANIGVRNPGDCMDCHGRSGGFIFSKDMLAESLAQKIKIKYKDPEQLANTERFFLSWQRKVKGYQDTYEDTVAYLTKGPDDKSLTGALMSTELVRLRDQYDDPLTPEISAAELGVTKETLFQLCRELIQKYPESQNDQSGVFMRGNRAKRLVQGLPVPRTVWDNDLYPSLQILRSQRVKEKN